MGGWAFTAQRRALHHSEAMLLINHAKPHIVKIDPFLNQGVGSDDYVNITSGDALLNFLLGAFLEASDEQPNSDRIGEHPGKLANWLASICVAGGFAQ
jgi:hypothetical protein